MPDSQHLPPPEQQQLSVGFMRLTDSAPLVIAREYGLFARYGLDVELQREVSWANLRDRLVAGALDAAQLLAPLPMATSLGAGGLRANLLTGLSLGLNGNAITLSSQLWQRMGGFHHGGLPDALQTAQTLNNTLKQQGGNGPITLATVHAFSMHTFLLRRWLRAGGIDPDRDVRLIVLPPGQMCDSLARGIIDGFCAGEPWSTVAVQQGIGSVAAATFQIWNNAPEKVLGVTEKWHQQHPASHLRLRLAIMEAACLLDQPECREDAATILSQCNYLDLPRQMILPSLGGQFRFDKQAEPVCLPDFHVFHKWQAGFPWRSHASSLMQMSSTLLGKDIGREESRALVQQCYRPDLYREAVRYNGGIAPQRDEKPEDQHDQAWQFSNDITLGPDRMLPLPHENQHME